MTTEPEPTPPAEREYLMRLRVDRLRQQVYARPSATGPAPDVDRLARAEADLAALGRQVAAARATAEDLEEMRGRHTTGLEVTVDVRMADVPTATYHLLDPVATPLVSVGVRNTSTGRRRVRVTSVLDGYSARAADTAELESGEEWVAHQLPTLFLDRVRDVTELTRATLDVLVEDLDGPVEVNRTVPVWMLARTTVPLAVRDPSTGLWTDLSRYLGAFVTPNAPVVRAFLSDVAGHHPERELMGYQGDRTRVEPQVAAVFAALADAGLAYVNSVLALSPEDGAEVQRVRLPRESLELRQANCVDATVLVASILEALSLSPAIVVLPGHVLVAWETWFRSGEWRYLETTMIASATFAEACAWAERTVAGYPAPDGSADGDPYRLRRWPLRTLRAEHRIHPME